MKTLRYLLSCMAVLFAVSVTPPLPAQSVSNYYAAGISYNGSATPAIAGTATYAHLVSATTGTYAFSMVDALPNGIKPFTVTTNIAAGVAQKIATIAGYDILVPVGAGISWNGPNTGWEWNGGIAVPIRLKPYKNGSFFLMPTARFLKSNVSAGGYQPILGVQFGWGQTS